MRKLSFLESRLQAVREGAPLVQAITNFVTVNDCANIILAIGGSPTMAHHIAEAAEAVEGAQALVLNMGAIEDADAMVLAGRRANQLGKPVVLDPVAAGGTALRREVAQRLLQELKLTVIRGNASEIRALAEGKNAGSGVDVGAVDAVTEENLSQGVELARELSRKTGAVVALSGVIDIITDGTRAGIIRNGCATMARITGSGCMLTALIGAFCGASPEQPFEAAAAGVAAMGVCGELAEARRLAQGTGTATFRNDLIDAVSNLTAQQLIGGARYEEIE
jgi:hydroxyethylthiazole kinase